MPDWKFRMFYLGELTRPAGLIYADYYDWPRTEVRDGQAGHLVEDFAIPPEWPRYVGIDFGAVNTSTIWAAVDPATGVSYLYRETLGGEQTTGSHCAAFLASAKDENLDVVFGGAPSEQQQRWDWQAHGVPVQRPYVADVEIAIDRTIELFRTRRLFVFTSLRGLRGELGSYSRVVDGDGLVTDKIADKAQYHRLDATRYMAPWLAYIEPADKQERAA